MRRVGFLVLGLVLIVGGLVGCAALTGALDTVFGTTPGGDDAPGTPPSDVVGGLLGTVLPGAAGVLALLRWGWVEIRRRKLAQSFTACVAGVTEAVDGAQGKPVSKDRLYEALTQASKIYANRDFFAKAVDKIKEQVRTPRE